jgi:hypothetical protein
MLAEHPASRTANPDDARDDEHESENEAPIREVDAITEAPEAFDVDDEGESGHFEDDGESTEEERVPARYRLGISMPIAATCR